MYFTESYCVPVEAATEMGLLSGAPGRANWVCVLSTDSYFLGAFDAELDKRVRATERYRREHPDHHFGAGLMFLLWDLAYGLISADYRSKDLELMRLQRREVLCEAVIGQGARQPIDQRLADLQAETDETWRRLYFSRVID